MKRLPFAILLLMSTTTLAGERQIYTGMVMVEYSGVEIDNPIGFSLNENNTIYSLVLSNRKVEPWLQAHLGQSVRVVGDKGYRGNKPYILVQELECKP